MKQQSWSLLVVVLTYIKYFIRNKKKKINNYNNFNYKIQIKKKRDLFIIKELFYTILVPRYKLLNNLTTIAK